MRTWVKSTSRAVVLTAGFVALGVSAVPASAAFADTTSGKSSVLGGNQVGAPVTAPVNACGNGAAAAGHAQAGCEGGASVHDGEGKGKGKGDGKGKGKGKGGKGKGGKGGKGHGHGHGVGSGNQVEVPITAPVNACGNAVAILGEAIAGCEGGASVRGGGDGSGRQTTSGKSSVLGGNQVGVPVTAPVDVCGNAVAVLGEAGALCKGGSAVRGPGGSGGDRHTDGKSSVLGGNQVGVPVTAPVDVCGNAVAVLGEAVAACKGGAAVGEGPRGDGHDDPGGHDSSSRFGRAASGPELPKTLPMYPAVQRPVPPAVSGAPAGVAFPQAPVVPMQRAAVMPPPVPVPGVGDVTGSAGTVPGVPFDRAGAVADGLGSPVGKVGAPEVPLGEMAPAASVAPLGGGAAASAWVLGVTMMFGLASGSLALTRRFRVGRR